MPAVAPEVNTISRSSPAFKNFAVVVLEDSYKLVASSLKK
jgi:hypothetical protein